jgi:hypothetical protein
MVLNCNGLLAKNYSGSCAIWIAGARSSTEHHKWRLIGNAFMAALLGNASYLRPDGDVSRVNIAVERASLFVAVWDDPSNMDIEEISQLHGVRRGSGCP